MKRIYHFFSSTIKYLYFSYRCKNIDFFDYRNLLKWDFTPPKFFNSVFLYGNYKAIANLQKKHFNFLTDYLEHGVCFIDNAESARLLGYIDRKQIKNIYTFGPFRHNLIKIYFEKKGLKKNIIEVGPYILGASNFYKSEKLSLIKEKYGKILLVYPQHSIENHIVNYEIDSLIREINTRKSHFDSIFVCLYWKDIIEHPKYVERYESEGFVVVSNGHRSDPQFLSRQKDLIMLSDMMMTNGIGTHIGYSICMNKPVYFFKQKIQIDTKAKEVSKNLISETELLFSTVFADFSFMITEEQKEITKYYWGE